MSDDQIDLDRLEDQELSALFSNSPAPEAEIEIIDSEPLTKSETGSEELIVDLPEFEDKRFSWLQKLSHRRQEIRHQLAGVDPIPPKNGVVLEFDPNDPFLQLLKPLPPNEILALSAEVSADDTVFVRIERQRRRQFRSHGLAAFLAAATMIVFALLVGPQFITETLINVRPPGWVPEQIPAEASEATLFVIGILVPIIAGFALLDGYRLLFSGLLTRRFWDLIQALPTLALGSASLVLVASGQVLKALGALAAQWVISVIFRWGGK